MLASAAVVNPDHGGSADTVSTLSGNSLEYSHTGSTVSRASVTTDLFNGLAIGSIAGSPDVDTADLGRDVNFVPAADASNSVPAVPAVGGGATVASTL